MQKKIIIIIMIILLIGITGCSLKKGGNNTSSSTTNNLLSYNELFSDRDLENSPDLSDATTYTIKDNDTITINQEGVYIIEGDASNSEIIVDVDDDSKVQLVLNGVTIENENKPAIYVKNADKVFVTLQGNNSLSVTGSFTSDGETSLDAVIFSKDDLIINGEGNLTVESSANGITSKDDLKITGGIINVTSQEDALEANNGIAIAGGEITINSEKDGLHAEDSEDDSVGYIYITNATLDITASDDALHAITVVEIDGGSITTNSREGIEGTYIQINAGTITIKATDDGINAAEQSTKYEATVEINAGEISIDMGQGDTDAIDSNGNLYLNGGEITITAQSPFDYDGEGKLNGATVIVNGEKISELTNQAVGGGPR